ncbi:glycosyltransferase family protein [Paenibacillus tengchongensis]|uniref:glycosyltransferase family protein n=1 Tax=Paenibacillus tengchongensis TaxID=2608684 RepID=UPI001651C7EE|nr:glycosyltransferase [Paenibacillus tengchongensis]
MLKKKKRKGAAVQTVRLHPKSEKLIAETVIHALKSLNALPPEFRNAAVPARLAHRPQQPLPPLESAETLPLAALPQEHLSGMPLLIHTGPHAASLAPAAPPAGSPETVPLILPQPEVPAQPPADRESVPPEPVPAAPQADQRPLTRVTVDYKTKRLLLVSPMHRDDLWTVEQSIAEEFRRLLYEVTSIKAYCGFSSMLKQLQPDLLLLIGSAGDFTDSDLDIIRSSSAVKAIWMDDGLSIDESALHLAALFPYVFTQNVQYIPFYRHLGCRQVTCLPFAADRSRFCPMAVEEEFRCDILLLGDFHPRGKEYYETIRHIFGFKKGYVCGAGWESLPELTALPAAAELQGYYNGAEIIIHWGQPASVLYDIAACGTFQLAEAHPNVYEYMHPGDDMIAFHTASELLEKLHYYSTNAEYKRAVASRALWRSTYDYSHLQMALKLLCSVFNT